LRRIYAAGRACFQEAAKQGVNGGNGRIASRADVTKRALIALPGCGM